MNWLVILMKLSIFPLSFSLFETVFFFFFLTVGLLMLFTTALSCHMIDWVTCACTSTQGKPVLVLTIILLMLFTTALLHHMIDWVTCAHTSTQGKPVAELTIIMSV